MQAEYKRSFLEAIASLLVTFSLTQSLTQSLSQSVTMLYLSKSFQHFHLYHQISIHQKRLIVIPVHSQSNTNTFSMHFQYILSTIPSNNIPYQF